MAVADMTTNLLRTCVGIESVSHLAEFQQEYRIFTDSHGEKLAALHTRRTPTRANDLINGGSVYWIITRLIQARQEIVDVLTIKDADGQDSCRILMRPEIIMVSPTPQRHIQGWRYLDPAKAPADLGLFNADDGDSMPPDPEMAEELRSLGLI